ncbi:MAG: nickel-dependent hydrogenase large subunit, partial [Magnetococcales bacterium]|nr:nickel-dependent hydrogenase large subunit [Magnetococcales bacterium]
VGGGLSIALTEEKVNTLRRLGAEALELCKELAGVIKEALEPKQELLTSLPLEMSNMGLVNDGVHELYDGQLRLRGTDGSVFEFPEDAWRDHLFERSSPVSYAKHVFCKTPNGEETYRVGPLARLNCCDRMDTPLAQAELETFRALGGSPCNHTVMYHYARLIELMNAAEKMHELLQDDEVRSDNVRTEPPGGFKNATSMVEAPRGTLIHDYSVDQNGILTDVNLIVATQQNIQAINETIGLSAAKYVDLEDQKLLNAVEFGVRCYDPCLSCATHRIGEMKLDVTVRRNGETLRRVKR